MAGVPLRCARERTEGRGVSAGLCRQRGVMRCRLARVIARRTAWKVREGAAVATALGCKLHNGCPVCEWQRGSPRPRDALPVHAAH